MQIAKNGFQAGYRDCVGKKFNREAKQKATCALRSYVQVRNS